MGRVPLLWKKTLRKKEEKICLTLQESKVSTGSFLGERVAVPFADITAFFLIQGTALLAEKTPKRKSNYHG